MYFFMTLEQINSFFTSIGLDLSLLSSFEMACIFLLSNLFVLIFYVFILSFIYKLVCRVVRFIF